MYCSQCSLEVLSDEFKGALCSSGEEILGRIQNLHFLYTETCWINHLSLFSWLNELSEQTDLEGQHSCFTLFICGGPCHISIFVLGHVFPLRTAYGKKRICIHLYYYLINIVVVEILGLNLSQTMWCSFNKAQANSWCISWFKETVTKPVAAQR